MLFDKVTALQRRRKFKKHEKSSGNEVMFTWNGYILSQKQYQKMFIANNPI